MDSLRTEMRSIIKIKDYLTRTPMLIPDIRENDKTPSWDGEIIVYNKESIAKKDIAGRVAIQIKGSVQSDLSKKTIKYTLDSSDIRNYLSSNGAIIFVVYMSDYENCKIYYNSLLPFDLIKLIDNIGEQKTKTIPLEEFPKEDQEQVTNIFLHFIRNQSLQGSIDRRLLSLSDVDKLGMEIDGIYFGHTGINFNNIIDVIDYTLKHPTYIYVQPKGFKINVPVDKINAQEILSDIKAKITIDNETLYENYKAVYKSEERILKIGKSFEFYLYSGKFHYNLSGTLINRIRDIKFLLALFYNKNININGVKLPERTVNAKYEDIKKHEELLCHLEEIKSTLDILDAMDDLEFDNLTDRDFRFLSLIVKAFHHNEDVPLSLDNKPGIGNLNIGNLVLKIVCQKSNNNNKFKLSNYFGTHKIRCTFESDGDIFIISHYVLLKKDDFLTISNINYSRIVDSILNTPKSSPQYEFTNQLVLEMLKAFDESNNDKILKASLMIMDWLLEYSNINKAILILNKMQIFKRKRDLKTKELEDIYEIKSNSTDIRILLGCSILLESFTEAKMYYNKLSEDCREEFDNYPISNLWDTRRDNIVPNK
ncbi:DUF4365 domain-containing protein [Natronospora cellulosivora (SeqCode)]